MTNDRFSGMALIAGSFGMIITMAMHPSGHIQPAQLEPMIRMMVAVHALGLACVPILFVGAFGLTQYISRNIQLSMTALVFYAFGLLAVMSAAVANGLILPQLFRQLVASAGSQAAIDGWRMMSQYNFFMNQAYAQVFVAASSVAIFLWSVAIWRGHQLPRGLGIYGCIISPVTLVALSSGRLPLDVHGFGAVVLAQAIWFIITGKFLWRSEKQLPLPR